MKNEVLERKVMFTLILFSIISALLTLNKVYFLSTLAQYLYYFIYIFITSLSLFILSKKYNIRFNHGVLTLITILIIGIVILNNIIALPFLLIYPIFYSRKSKTFSKILSGLLYSFLIFIFLFSAFVKLMFSSNKLLLQKSSPNKKYNVVVIDNDQGALGGNTIVELEKIYFNSIKKQRTVYIDRWGKSLEVEWIDNENVKIDENIINVNRKDKIDKRNSL